MVVAGLDAAMTVLKGLKPLGRSWTCCSLSLLFEDVNMLDGAFREGTPLRFQEGSSLDLNRAVGWWPELQAHYPGASRHPCSERRDKAARINFSF
jgi:hypothetical protein